MSGVIIGKHMCATTTRGMFIKCRNNIFTDKKVFPCNVMLFVLVFILKNKKINFGGKYFVFSRKARDLLLYHHIKEKCAKVFESEET